MMPKANRKPHKGLHNAESENTHVSTQLHDPLDLTDGELHVGCRAVASDAALTIDGSDSVILLRGSAAGAKAATITPPRLSATNGGPRLKLILEARSGGSYTVACTYLGAAGTLTLDAAAEAPELCWIAGTLHVVELGGATHA